MTRRVVMLLSNDAVSDPRVEKEARALFSAGFEVVIVAWNRSGDANASEERDGFRIERVGPPAAHGGGARNIGPYRRFWREAAQRVVSLRPAVIHCHDADTVPAGLRARRMLGARGNAPALVVDFHELYRDSKMVPQGGLVGRVARPAVARVERTAARSASLVIVANPGTAEYYARLGERDDVLVVENAPDARLFAPPSPSPRGPGDAFTVCYIGQKRYLRNLEVLMQAVQGLEGVEAFLAGGGVDAEAVERLAGGYERVRTEGRLKYAEIPSRYHGCDAVYAVNDTRVGNMRVNFPVKAMEGMAFGLPIIVNAGTWVGEYAEKHGVGLAVDGEDPASVAAALARLRDDPQLAAEMGRRGRALVEAGLNWDSAAARLVAAYSALT